MGKKLRAEKMRRNVCKALVYLVVRLSELREFESLTAVNGFAELNVRAFSTAGPI